jgi:hypothetical protein
MSDDLRALTTRLLAHLGRDDGWRLGPDAWVLGEWRFTPLVPRQGSVVSRGLNSTVPRAAANAMLPT